MPPPAFPPTGPIHFSLPINSHNGDDDGAYIDMPPAYGPTPAPTPLPFPSPGIMNFAPPNSATSSHTTSPTSPPPRNPPTNPEPPSSSSWPGDDAIPEFERKNNNGFLDTDAYLTKEEDGDDDDDHAASLQHRQQQQQQQQQPRRYSRTTLGGAARSGDDDDATMMRHHPAAPALPRLHHTSGMMRRRWYDGGIENCSYCCCCSRDDDNDATIEEFGHSVFVAGMVMDMLTVVTYIVARYRAVARGSVMEEAVVRVEFETRMGDVLMVVVGGVLWAAVVMGGGRGVSAPSEVGVRRAAQYIGVAVVVYVGAARGVDGLVDWVGGRV